jgi:hypothetical protein
MPTAGGGLDVDRDRRRRHRGMIEADAAELALHVEAHALAEAEQGDRAAGVGVAQLDAGRDQRGEPGQRHRRRADVQRVRARRDHHRLRHTAVVEVADQGQRRRAGLQGVADHRAAHHQRIAADVGADHAADRHRAAEAGRRQREIGAAALELGAHGEHTAAAANGDRPGHQAHAAGLRMQLDAAGLEAAQADHVDDQRALGDHDPAQALAATRRATPHRSPGRHPLDHAGQVGAAGAIDPGPQARRLDPHLVGAQPAAEQAAHADRGLDRVGGHQVADREVGQPDGAGQPEIDRADRDRLPGQRGQRGRQAAIDPGGEHAARRQRHRGRQQRGRDQPAAVAAAARLRRLGQCVSAANAASPCAGARSGRRLAAGALAVRRMASHRSSKDRPAASAILGSRLVRVKPGSVLTSRMYSLPDSLTMMSTRVAPVQPRARCARRAWVRTPR